MCGGVIINVDVWSGLSVHRGRAVGPPRADASVTASRAPTRRAGGSGGLAGGVCTTLDAATRRRDTTGTTLCILVLALPHTTPAANPILAKDQDQDAAAAPAK